MLGSGVPATPQSSSSYQASSRAAPVKAEEEAAQQQPIAETADTNTDAASSPPASCSPPSLHRTSPSLVSGIRRSNRVVPQPALPQRRGAEEAAAAAHLSLRVALPVSPLAISSPSSSPQPGRQQAAAAAAVRPSLPHLILSPSSSSPSIQTIDEQLLSPSELPSPSELALTVDDDGELADDWDVSDCCGCFLLSSPSPVSSPQPQQQQQHADAASALTSPVSAQQPAEAERVWDGRLSTGQTPPPVHLLKPPAAFPRASSLPLPPASSRMQRLQRTVRRSFNTASLTAAVKTRRWGGRAGGGGAAAGGGGEASSSSPTAVSATADLLRAMPVERRSFMGTDSPTAPLQAATEGRPPDQLQPDAVSAVAG